MYYNSKFQITRAVAERLINLEGTRVSVPVMPLPGDALADLIFRAACLNGLAVVTPFLPENVQKLGHYKCATYDFDISILSDILGTANGSADLKPLLYERVQGGGVNFFGARLGSRMFTASRRVAPRSLREVISSKAIWHVKSLTFDPTSHERLLDKCPECLTKLDFRHSYGINRCHKCGPGLDLRDFPQDIEEFEDVSAIRFLTGLVDPQRPEGKQAVGDLHPSLASEDPGDIFSLCVILAELIAFDGPRRGRSKEQDISPSHLEAASAALLSWPGGVISLIGEIENGVIPSGAGSQGGKLAIACSGKRLSKSLIRSVNELFKTYRFKVGSYARSEAEDTRPPHLRNVSGTHPLEVARRSMQFRRAKVATGIPHLALYGCFLSGYFGPVNDESNLHGKGIDEWTASLNFHEIPVVHDVKVMPLTNYVKATFSGEGDPWPHLLNVIRGRLLPIVRLPGAKTLLSDLLISDFDAWMKFTSIVEPTEGIDNLVIRGGDCAFLFNVSIKTLSRSFEWPVGTTFSDIKVFDRQYATLQEIVDRLYLRGENTSVQRIRYYLDKAGIQSHQRLWRNRDEAERYFGLSQ